MKLAMKLWFIFRAAYLAALLTLVVGGVAEAHDCSSPGDCEQTAGYNGALALGGATIAIGTAIVASGFGASVGAGVTTVGADGFGTEGTEAPEAPEGPEGGPEGAEPGAAPEPQQPEGPDQGETQEEPPEFFPPSPPTEIISGPEANETLINGGLPTIDVNGNTYIVPPGTNENWPPGIHGGAWPTTQVTHPTTGEVVDVIPPGGATIIRDIPPSAAPPEATPPEVATPPEETPPEETPPEEAPPEETPPGETPPEETPPEETPPEETPPEETPPGETPPGETPPGETPPEETPPEETPPEETPPEESPPEETPPEETPPEETPPEETPPEEEEPPEETPPEEVPPEETPSGPPTLQDIDDMLQNTETGKDAMQYILDNNIPVVYGVPGKGSFWNGTSIVIDPNQSAQDVALVVVHEVNHAKCGQSGVSGDVMGQTKADYVETMMNEETDGTVASIEAKNESVAAGKDVQATFPLEPEYNAAYTKAADAYKAAHKDAPAEEVADAGKKAGRDAVKDGFLNGKVVTSTPPKISYPDFYGKYWNGKHPGAT